MLMLMMHEIIKFLVDEERLINSEDDGEINILAAATTFMRRYLCHTSNTILNVLCQHIDPYSIDEFNILALPKESLASGTNSTYHLL